MLREPQHERNFPKHLISPFVLSLPCLSQVEGSKDSERVFQRPAGVTIQKHYAGRVERSKRRPSGSASANSPILQPSISFCVICPNTPPANSFGAQRGLARPNSSTSFFTSSMLSTA